MRRSSLPVPLVALLAGAGIVFTALPARAEYQTVETAATLYDTSSLKGRKLFVIRAETPVEIVVPLKDWIKIRDADGSLAWIEKTHLGPRRTVIVRSDWARIRQKPDENAPLVFEAERNVSLNYLETVPGGWIKARHRDGQEGYVRASEIWGY